MTRSDTTPPAWVSALCFSKDRPFQLQAYLESLQWATSHPVDIAVLCSISSEEWRLGYQEVSRRFPVVRWIWEEDFGKQFLEWLQALRSPLVVFGCDDVVFVRPFDLRTIVLELRDAETLGFSLRLGKNVRYCHSRSEAVPAPIFLNESTVLTWNWTTGEKHWGYPFELNGTVYRTELVAGLFRTLETLRLRKPPFDWRHPNLIEISANLLIKQLGQPSRMKSFAESCLVVPTVNRVQDLVTNHLMGISYAPEKLEELRRAGWRVDMEAYRKQAFDRIHVGCFPLIQQTGPAP